MALVAPTNTCMICTYSARNLILATKGEAASWRNDHPTNEPPNSGPISYGSPLARGDLPRDPCIKRQRVNPRNANCNGNVGLELRERLNTWYGDFAVLPGLRAPGNTCYRRTHHLTPASRPLIRMTLPQSPTLVHTDLRARRGMRFARRPRPIHAMHWSTHG